MLQTTVLQAQLIEDTFVEEALSFGKEVGQYNMDHTLEIIIWNYLLEITVVIAVVAVIVMK